MKQAKRFGKWGRPKTPRRYNGFVAHNFREDVSFIARTPQIVLSRRAYRQMWHIVDITETEVGWMGTAIELDNGDIGIDEIFVVEQTVTATETELSSEGLANLASEIMATRQNDEALQLLNSLRFWGHSHVDMAVNPSGQDEAQMAEFAEAGHDFMVRGIFNKRGEVRFSIFYYTLGIKVDDVAWSLYDTVDDHQRELVEEIVKAKVTERVVPLKSYVPQGAAGYQIDLEGYGDNGALGALAQAAQKTDDKETRIPGQFEQPPKVADLEQLLEQHRRDTETSGVSAIGGEASNEC